MRRALIAPAALALLAGPAILAFFAGGYFTEPRLWAALGVWLGVLGLALAGPAPLPRSRAGRAALAGLVLICALTGLSITWAPLADPATQSLERLLLYVGAFLVAFGLLRERRVWRLAEPALALGAVVAVGYGVAGRLLPRTISEQPSLGAGDRLDQPLTYWNAEGALAAIGLVLCARLAGDPERPTAQRAVAAGACAPLGLGLYLTYSRGAIVAAIVGLAVLLAAAPTRAQLRALGTAAGAALLAALAGGLFASVARLEGTLTARQHDGTLVLGALLLLAAVAAGLTLSAARRERAGAALPLPLRLARALPVFATALIVLALAGLVAGALGERSSRTTLIERNGGQRLVAFSSRRYDYWRVGLSALGRHPLNGTGAGGFRAAWLAHRPVPEGVQEIHSIELEMLVELGPLGAAAFLLFIGGSAAAARGAARRTPEASAGAIAACAVWLLHATIDWDWQMPAVTLPALILAAGLVARSEWAPEAPPPSFASSPERLIAERI